MPIQIAATDAQLERCFPVMGELRPHLTREQFVTQVRRQRDTQGYELAFLEVKGEVVAAAGFRIVEMLAWGRAMYVDDLVTTAQRQGQGFATELFDWLVARARTAGCAQLHLDSGVHRHRAHRFYLCREMDITSHHFALKL